MGHLATLEPILLPCELTIYQAAACYLELSEKLIRDGELHLDLRHVNEVDCAGLQVLLQLSNVAKQRGSEIRFYHISVSVQNLIDLLALGAHFASEEGLKRS